MTSVGILRSSVPSGENSCCLCTKGRRYKAVSVVGALWVKGQDQEVRKEEKKVRSGRIFFLGCPRAWHPGEPWQVVDQKSDRR